MPAPAAGISEFDMPPDIVLGGVMTGGAMTGGSVTGGVVDGSIANGCVIVTGVVVAGVPVVGVPVVGVTVVGVPVEAVGVDPPPPLLHPANSTMHATAKSGFLIVFTCSSPVVFLKPDPGPKWCRAITSITNNPARRAIYP